MTEQPGFKAFEKRIEELLEKSRDISPRRHAQPFAAGRLQPSFDIAKEIERLRTASSTPKDE